MIFPVDGTNKIGYRETLKGIIFAGGDTMRPLFIGFFAVLLFAACENTTANKSDVDTVATDGDTAAVVDDDQADQTDQSDLTDQSDDMITDNPVTDDIVDEMPDTDMAGADCATNDQCGEDEFCAKPLGSCSEAIAGKCNGRPTDCFMTRAVVPQCGCDDYTYSNECWAAASGAVIAHAGECAGDVLCFRNDECGENEFCEKKMGVCNMGFGVCRPQPTDCPKPEEPAPVCGCDLRDYGDECTAWMNDVPVKHDGECTGPDDSMVRYFYADNAETPDGYLRIVVSPTDIREFWTTDTFTEQFNGNSSVTLTVRFYESDLPESDYAELQYTLSLPPTLPMGVGFGYEGSYLRWYSFNGVALGDMQGTVITYEYVRHDAGNEVSTLVVRGLNLWVGE